MAKSRKRTLKSLKDLRPAPYNPRQISDDAMAGLRVSLSEFGDISGLVWNQRTGNLICGHQRLEALKRDTRGVEFRREPGGPALVAGGVSFPIRVVDWDKAREKLANIAANNPHLTGEFSGDLPPLAAELTSDDSLAGLADDLRIGELAVDDGIDGDDTFADLGGVDDADVLGDGLGDSGAKVVSAWNLFVECKDERDQRKVYEALKRRGYKCRVLTT